MLVPIRIHTYVRFDLIRFDSIRLHSITPEPLGLRKVRWGTRVWEISYEKICVKFGKKPEAGPGSGEISYIRALGRALRGLARFRFLWLFGSACLGSDRFMSAWLGEAGLSLARLGSARCWSTGFEQGSARLGQGSARGEHPFFSREVRKKMINRPSPYIYIYYKYLISITSYPLLLCLPGWSSH